MANILSPEWEAELPGLRGQRVGAAAGAEKLGATLYEVDPGGRVSPLHTHHANEELLIVLSGTPTLRTGEGERELAAGDVVAFPAGRRGTHQVLNRSAEAARVRREVCVRNDFSVRGTGSGDRPGHQSHPVWIISRKGP